MTDGKIIKALSGFYYVQTDDKVVECRGRGLFRKKKITPLVGDYVEIDIQDDGSGYITSIYDRNNELIRPPIANIDQAFIVTSAINPAFSDLLLDRFLVLAESENIQPIVIITKMDLLDDQERLKIKQFQHAYQEIGYPVFLVSSKGKEGIHELIPYIEGKTTVVAGQSGAGKSTLLNELKPGLNLETKDISKSLGRGKHTTRHVELLSMHGGLIADTPGFSSLEFQKLEAQELSDCFPEMREKSPYCKFRGCLHHQEPKCAVKQAVEQKEIPPFRYEHYLHFLQEIQNRKPRYER
ncbi:MAG: ribosome small subunit-dependent GTPase A [Bacillaceae bacterium]|nr:ribosome small subunit-dependent GTPase A [Bacillaceae bacterium]